jgi:hypothetical protein
MFSRKPQPPKQKQAQSLEDMEPANGRHPDEQQQEGEEQIRIDGFQQVLEMLKIADPEFRESLLARLATRDRQLANNLRRDLAEFDL